MVDGLERSAQSFRGECGLPVHVSVLSSLTIITVHGFIMYLDVLVTFLK